MVALLVGLKLTLLRNGLRRSVWRTVGLVLAAVYALGLVAGVWAGMIGLRYTSTALTADVTVVAFSVLTLGWLLFSLLVFGVDETVDPRRFALLPVPARRLVPGLFVAGLIGVPGAATVLAALALVATWARGPAPTVAALVAVPLGVATCFLLSRTATSAFSQALSSRRFRDFAAVALALFGAGVGITVNVFSRASAENPAAARILLHDLAAGFGWSPLGWAWALPADVARGAWAQAGVRLVLAAGFVVLLWLGWEYFLALALCSPIEPGGTAKAVRGHGVPDRLYPATPAGAVAGRALRYWRRDPRYLASLAALCVVPVVLVVAVPVQGASGGNSFAALAPVFLALLLGAVVAQDLSYDGSAIWTHITAGVAGRADRAGRVMSTVTVVGPVLLAVLLIAVGFTGQWSQLPRSAALTFGFGMISIGVGSWIGAIWQVPAPPPGANPFAKNTSGGGLKGLVTFAVTSGLTFVLGLPILALVIGSYWIGWLEWVGLVVAVAEGALVLWAGVRLGGRRLDTHWPEVLIAVAARS